MTKQMPIPVDKDIAEAIDYFSKEGFTNAQILVKAVDGTFKREEIPHVKALRKLDADCLMRVLVIGHEAKKTLEQNLVMIVKAYGDEPKVQEGIRYALEIVAQHLPHLSHLSSWAHADFKEDPQDYPTQPPPSPKNSEEYNMLEAQLYQTMKGLTNVLYNCSQFPSVDKLHSALDSIKRMVLEYNETSGKHIDVEDMRNERIS